MKETYRQCKLRRENSYLVTYIPSVYAVVGNIVKLRDKDGKWTDGWCILSVTQEESLEDALEEDGWIDF